jgi:cytochrome c biogenesis factor
MTELFTNIKFLKLYGWVGWFKARLDKVRAQDQQASRRSIEKYIVFDAFSSFLRSLLPVLTFTIFVGFGNTLDLATVIVAQDYFYRLSPVLTAVPNMLKSYKDI